MTTRVLLAIALSLHTSVFAQTSPAQTSPAQTQDTLSAHGGAAGDSIGVPTIQPAAPQLTPEQEKLARSINMRLRCPVCQSSSVEESPAFPSQEMKAVVREQVAAGKSQAEIESYFVSKYGEWILLKPRAHGFNLAIYVLPVMLVLLGGFFVYRTARKWTQA